MGLGLSGQAGYFVQSLAVEGQHKDGAFAIHQDMEEGIVKGKTKKKKVATHRHVQLMVFGMIGQGGVPVPKVVVVEPKDEGVIVTHQEMEEKIVEERMRNLLHVIIRVVQIVGVQKNAIGLRGHVLKVTLLLIKFLVMRKDFRVQLSY